MRPLAAIDIDRLPRSDATLTAGLSAPSWSEIIGVCQAGRLGLINRPVSYFDNSPDKVLLVG